MFWKQNDTMKGKCYVYGCYKQRNKVCLVYLECKLQQYKYGWCIFKWKFQKTVERKYLETSKQQPDLFRC